VNPSAIEQAVLRGLAEHYGLHGRLHRLAGENLNFLLTTNDEQKFVCKVVEQDSQETAAEVEHALLEAARTGGFPAELPYIHKTNTQKYETGINIPMKGVWSMRLMNFVHGTLLENLTDISIKLLENTGRALAGFDRALAGFDHPALHRTHHWDLAAADRHRDRIGLIGDAAQRSLVNWAFERWSEARAVLPALPQQVIHGDANTENLLAEGDAITGLVDLGDCLYGARVCDPAICIAYLMMGRDDPLAVARTVVAGYDSVVELAPAEHEVLLPLACGRLAVTVCMATHRRTIDPGNDNWFVSLAPALRLLEQLRETA
jgi:Ser/Thr protein kinase RdoA (MazF antagonist)